MQMTQGTMGKGIQVHKVYNTHHRSITQVQVAQLERRRDRCSHSHLLGEPYPISQVDPEKWVMRSDTKCTLQQQRWASRLFSRCRGIDDDRRNFFFLDFNFTVDL